MFLQMVEMFYEKLDKYVNSELKRLPELPLNNLVKFTIWSMKNESPYKILVPSFKLRDCSIIYSESKNSCYVVSESNFEIVQGFINNTIMESDRNESYEIIDSINESDITNNMKCVI